MAKPVCFCARAADMPKKSTPTIINTFFIRLNCVWVHPDSYDAIVKKESVELQYMF